jgi:hypothetical protein
VKRTDFQFLSHCCNPELIGRLKREFGWVSCPDGETATRLATTLVKEGLAACVNQLPEVTSTYLWEGRVASPILCCEASGRRRYREYGDKVRNDAAED